jgi:hypothetical protein
MGLKRLNPSIHVRLNRYRHFKWDSLVPKAWRHLSIMHESIEGVIVSSCRALDANLWLRFCDPFKSLGLKGMLLIIRFLY